jgi:DNA repair exonuclease SbcCD ATPase subunit
MRTQIDTAVAEIQALRAKRERDERTAALNPPPAPSASASAAPRPVAAAPAGNAPPQMSEEEKLRIDRRLAELPVTIDSKERTISELEGNRIRRLTDLQTKLQEQRAVYTSAHPAVTDIEQAIAASSQESSQVSKLRSEVKQLRNEFDNLRLKSSKPVRPLGAPRGAEAGLSSGRGLGDVIRIEQESAEDRDPEIEYARSRLRFAITSYQSLQDEISRARLDLATSEAAFKYRYVMVQPPEIPKGPIKPKVGLIVTGAMIAGLFLGLVMAMALELRDGVVRENWQVETVLDLPVLCSIPSPELRRLP